MRKALTLALVLASTVAIAGQYTLEFADEPRKGMTEEQFRETPEFKSAVVKGRLLYHTGGFMQFTQGPQWEDKLPNGAHNPTISNDTQTMLLGYCNKTGANFPNGRPVYNCFVLNRAGQVENSDHNGSGVFFDGEYNPQRRGAVRVVNGRIQSVVEDTLHY